MSRQDSQKLGYHNGTIALPGVHTSARQAVLGTVYLHPAEQIIHRMVNRRDNICAVGQSTGLLIEHEV